MLDQKSLGLKLASCEELDFCEKDENVLWRQGTGLILNFLVAIWNVDEGVWVSQQYIFCVPEMFKFGVFIFKKILGIFRGHEKLRY